MIDREGVWDPRLTRVPIAWADIRAIYPRVRVGLGVYVPRDVVQLDLKPEARGRLRWSGWWWLLSTHTLATGWDAVALSSAYTDLQPDDLRREMKSRAGPLWRDHP